ncbi:hypothetical protein ZWY2020_046851 [Hordeum vulgare]|nr:hypothetical protein ZWY2020_046851 [Hordeum vulgare]
MSSSSSSMDHTPAPPSCAGCSPSPPEIFALFILVASRSPSSPSLLSPPTPAPPPPPPALSAPLFVGPALSRRPRAASNPSPPRFRIPDLQLGGDAGMLRRCLLALYHPNLHPAPGRGRPRLRTVPDLAAFVASHQCSRRLRQRAGGGEE